MYLHVFCWGYGAAYGPTNGQGPQPNGKSTKLVLFVPSKKHENPSFFSWLTLLLIVVIFFFFFSHSGKKPQNGGGIGRMLMPSKGNWSECTCFFPLLWQCHVKLFSFSQVLVRQWVHKMDLVDTQTKEWVSPLVQQGAAWVLVRLLVLIYKLCLVHSRLRCSCWYHHGRRDQRQVDVCLFVFSSWHL